jgi:GntR family transcriptional regulator/MocR family aminotransferase
MARAYRRALRSPAARGALDYADAYGAPRLRAAIAAMLRATRGIPAGPENVMITRGSQLALDLAARLLVRPGDAAVVEELGYQPAWRALEAAGARLVPARLDGAGLVVDGIPAAARCLYATPHHQYPTTVLLSPARRLALLAHAREHGLAIIEDDYDHELHFDGRPVAPLAAADRGATVLYVGTLSKVLAPGLRLGFVAASERVIEQLARLRFIVDRQGDHVLEHAVAELVEEGELARHARKARRIYEGRRDALVTALRKELGGALSFALPPGGMTLWARVDPEIRLEAWRQAALARGVALAVARDFDLERRPRPFVRLAFARHSEAELADAVRLLRRALVEVQRGR